MPVVVRAKGALFGVLCTSNSFMMENEPMHGRTQPVPDHSRAPAASMAVLCARVQACRWCCCGMASTLASWAGTWQRCPASRW